MFKYASLGVAVGLLLVVGLRSHAEPDETFAILKKLVVDNRTPAALTVYINGNNVGTAKAKGVSFFLYKDQPGTTTTIQALESGGRQRSFLENVGTPDVDTYNWLLTD
jgi:hypothetical protein